MKAAARNFAIAGALAFAFYSRIFWTHTWFDQWDLAVQEIPRFDFLARTYQTEGRLPRWDPHLWAGQPVLGMPQPGPLYPLNWVIYLWPVEDGHVPAAALNVYFVLIHVQALLLMYLLARELGADRWGAWLGASLYSFGGVMGTSPWPDHLNGVVWAPGLAWVAVRIYRGRAPWWSALAGGVMLGLAWLSGHHEAPYWLTLALGVALVPRWRQLALVLAVAALVGAPQVVPSMEFGKRSRRFVETGRALAWDERVPYQIHEKYSWSWRGVTGVVLPGQDAQAGNMAYAGFSGAMVAAVGWRSAPWWSAMALTSGVLALGGHTPVHGWLYRAVPMADKARVPVRVLFLLNLVLAVWAALGFQRLSGKLRWVACLGMAAELWMASSERITPRTGASLAGWREQHADLIQALRRLPEPRRVMADPADLPFNIGDALGVDQIYGILPMVSANMEQHELHTPRVQDLFAVTHVVARRSAETSLREIFRSRRGIAIYQRSHPLPRAWFADGVEQVPDDGALRARLQVPDFSLRTLLSTGTRPAKPRCEARVSSYRRVASGRIRLEVEAPCDSILVLAETADPKWQVSTDGRDGQWLTAEGALLAVEVPEGTTTVDWRYDK